MKTINDTDYLTYKDVAHELKCSETKVSYLKKKKYIEFKKIDGKFRCTSKEFERFKRKMEERGKASPFGNILLDWDESCKPINSYEPQGIGSSFYVPSLKYFVTDKGRIFNVDYTRELYQAADTNGYMNTSIVGRDGETKQILVHRLVAGYWNDNFRMKLYVHHINGKREDNRKINLLWVTKSEHDELHRLMREGKKKEYRRRIAEITKDNAYPKEWLNSIIIPDPEKPETDDSIYYLRIKEKGFRDYEMTGEIKPVDILAEYVFSKNIDSIRTEIRKKKLNE